MSWGFKPLDEVTRAATSAFAVIDPKHPEGIRPHELADDYAAAVDLALPEIVPQSVRDYFDAARMMWVYGWFYYPFYTLAAFHGSLCVELALKERFRTEGVTLSRKDSRLEAMLHEAAERKWLVAGGFSTIRRRKERQEFMTEAWANALGEEPGSIQSSEQQEKEFDAGMRRLLENLRYFRNTRAHPEGLMVLLPGMTYSELVFARDLVAQLFQHASKP